MTTSWERRGLALAAAYRQSAGAQRVVGSIAWLAATVANGLDRLRKP